MKVMTFLGACWLLTFLFFAGCAWSLNPGDWGGLTRTACLVGFIFWAIVTAAIHEAGKSP